MTRTIVDSNVFLDILTDDPQWADWSDRQLAAALDRGALLINEAVYAELSVRFDARDLLDRFLDDFGVVVMATSRPALFAAGKAFGSYRAAGGPRESLLPDFFIGAFAQIERCPLLTRDARRYRSYFPSVALIAPDAT